MAGKKSHALLGKIEKVNAVGPIDTSPPEFRPDLSLVKVMDLKDFS